MQIVRKNLAFYGAKLFDAHDVLMKMHKRYIKFDEKPTEYMGLHGMVSLMKATG